MKITPDMAKQLESKGAVVKKARPKRKPKPPEVAAAPQPAPATAANPQIDELVAALREQVSAMSLQLAAAEKQNQELKLMLQAQMSEKPVRLKVRRDMDRQSPTYLLLEHIDVVPVEYRKLQ